MAERWRGYQWRNHSERPIPRAVRRAVPALTMAKLPRGEILEDVSMGGVMEDGGWGFSSRGEDSVIWRAGRGEDETVAMSKVVVKYA